MAPFPRNGNPGLLASTIIRKSLCLSKRYLRLTMIINYFTHILYLYHFDRLNDPVCESKFYDRQLDIRFHPRATETDMNIIFTLKN